MITDEAHPDATVIFGTVFDTSLEDEMKITLIATGFEKEGKKKAVPVPEFKPEQPVKDKTIEKEFNEIFDLLNKKREL